MTQMTYPDDKFISRVRVDMIRHQRELMHYRKGMQAVQQGILMEWLKRNGIDPTGWSIRDCEETATAQRSDESEDCQG